MSFAKKLSLLLALAVVLPFAGMQYFDWLDLTQDIDSVTVSTVIQQHPVALIYSIGIYAVFLVLLYRCKTILKREKYTWFICLLFFFPVASLAMLYRAYWHKPVRVAKSVQEQVEILRELRGTMDDDDHPRV